MLLSGDMVDLTTVIGLAVYARVITSFHTLGDAAVASSLELMNSDNNEN